MKYLSKALIGTVAAGAMAVTSASPAMARDRHDDGIGAGEIIAGALIMSVLLNGLRILSVAQEWQTVVTGLIIIAAVYADMLRRRRAG